MPSSRDVLLLAVMSLLGLVPLWISTYPPMVDLPQHAAQITIWTAYADSSSGYAELFEFNWFTPYLLGYSITRVLRAVAGPVLSIKIVLSLALLALPWATRRLLRDLGGEGNLALLAIPLGYGFAYYWGFFNYLIAIPFGLLVLSETWRFAGSQTTTRGIRVALGVVVLFFAHVLVLGLVGLVSVGFVFLRSNRWSHRFVGLAPLAVALPLIGIWLSRQAGRMAEGTEVVWGEWGKRFYHVVGLQLGSPEDLVAVGTILALIVALLAAGLRIRATTSRALLALVAFGCFLAFPLYGFNMPLINERYAVFVGLGALLLGDVRKNGAAARRITVVACVFCVVWIGLLSYRHAGFSGEVTGFDQVISHIEPDKKLRILNVTRTSEFIPQRFPVLMHHQAWYQAQKRGLISFSFAQLYPELMRYRETPRFAVPSGLESRPEVFNYAAERFLFDYFLVQSKRDVSARLFGANNPEIELVASEGIWRLYRRKP